MPFSGHSAPNELSLYAVESYWTDNFDLLRRYTLRLDGFVSVQAPMRGGELVTRPIIFTGKTLRINFATSAAGSLRVELQDAQGKPLPGFSLDHCEEMFGDSLDRTVQWTPKANLSPLIGQPVRVRFVLRVANLYSFQFRH